MNEERFRFKGRDGLIAEIKRLEEENNRYKEAILKIFEAQISCSRKTGYSCHEFQEIASEALEEGE